MRIIATDKSRDYYDPLSNYHDSNVYVRNSSYIPLSKNNKIFEYLTNNENKIIFQTISLPRHDMTKYLSIGYTWMDLEVFPFVVVFCGRVYAGLVHESIKKNEYSGHPEYEIYYNLDDFVNRFRKHSIYQLGINFDEIEHSKSKYKRYFRKNNYTINDLSRLFDEKFLQRFSNLNIELNSPIVLITNMNDSQCFIRNNISITTDANLKLIKFNKIKDINQCYQEIDMYISNILVSDKMPENKISDKLRAESKGFDKYSFRKSSTKIR